MPRGLRSHARDAIQAEEIIVKMNKYCMASPTQAKAMLSTAQVNAMKILLNKVLPDLKAIELTDEDGKAVTQAIKIEFVDSIK